MQHNGGWRLSTSQLSFKVALARLQVVHLSLHALVKHPLGNGVHDAVNLANDLRQVTFGFGFINRTQSCETVVFFLICFGELGNQVRVEQLIFEADQ
ncbi:hypothetical protein [Shimia sp.]|uniref:hypothetical protein n=1 Tax=Shimia sp. TaxID=1954381 RepID=UPI003BA9A775